MLRHALAQQPFELLHALLGSLEAHGAAQVFRLAAGEAGHRHRHAQQLFLEQRHAERALQDRLEQRMIEDDRLAAGAAIEIRVHHLPDDRTRTNQGDFDDEVVEFFGTKARQRRHLRARFHLEDADGFGAAQHVVDLGVVGRQ